MSYQPMAMRSDVTSVLSAAQDAVGEFSRDAIFSSGEHAAIDLLSELRSYQRFHYTRTSNNNNDPTTQANFESSLTANLLPCSNALRIMLDIRRKYPRDGKLGFLDKTRWKRDEKEFEQQAKALRQDTARLRELVQTLQQSAVVSSGSQQQRPSHDRGFGTPAFQTQTTVSIGRVQYASPPPQQYAQGTSSTNSFNSISPQNQNNRTTPTEMCPNGSGCRTPRCHLQYRHPDAPECENGRNCGLRNCEKWHPKSAHCPKGPSCPMVGCDKAHPWPREQQPVSPIPYQANSGSASSLNNSISDVSSTMGSQSSLQPSEWNSRGVAPTRQVPWQGGQGTTQSAGGPVTQLGAPIVVTVQSSFGGHGNQRTSNSSYSTGGNQGWCPKRFQCPGGYNGMCRLRHPRRTACRDLAERGHCPRGDSCTYDHSGAEANKAQQGASPYMAELPAWR
ncbi:hypothetical protein B0H66DRAFT_600310 [Apodospora peruviana]|uniref:C3H1-type domain-containing protein n=1 Tax=Apodospora peruviana TaxID=516989 RepID=A0AAE0MB66_9PEZI|nr:hypothetical protein B0H66DRAFT_600310 [Apodospora peruviana]